VASLLASLLAAYPAVASHAGEPAEPGRATVSELELARYAYEQGSYPQVVALLRPLLFPTPSLTSAEQPVALALLGKALYHTQRLDEAREALAQLLLLLPEYRLDPLVEPPALVALLDSVRREREGLIARATKERLLEEQRRRGQLERLRVEREARERAARAPVYVVVRETTAERPRLPIFLPFGAGQFNNAQPAKGWLFLGSELLLGAASLGIFASLQLSYPDGQVPTDEVTRARQLQTAQLVLGGLFFAVAGLGILDAYLGYTPRTTTVRTRRLAPGELPPRPLPATRSGGAAPRLSWSPLGIAGTF
jgi:tetratricopeptide (TPR) repeat protein